MKKIISLILAVLLCLGAVPLTALAEEPTEPSVNYVALSDSMGQGYMFTDYNEDATTDHYCGWEGISHKDESYIWHFFKDLKEDFGEDNVHFTDLTIQGLQPDEVYAFLKPETFDFNSMTRGAKKHIGWWVGDYETDEEQNPNTFIFETFKDMSDYYIDAIKSADIITYDIGMNYFGTFLTDEHGENEDYNDLLDNWYDRLLVSIFRATLLNLFQGSDNADTLIDRILYSYVSYIVYTEKCIGAIYELNPDVKLIVVPLANPHRELYVDLGDVTVSYTLVLDTMMESLNDYMREDCTYRTKYYFAELDGDVISFADELYFYPDDLSEDVEVLLGQAVMGSNSILGTNNYPAFPEFAELYEGAVQSGNTDLIMYFQYMLYFAVDEYGETLTDEDGNYLMCWNVLDRLIYDYISEKYDEDVAYDNFFGNYIDLVLYGPSVMPTPSVTGDNILNLGYVDINVNPEMIDRARAAIEAGTAEDWQKHIVEAADVYVGDWKGLCLKAAQKRVFPADLLTGNFDMNSSFTTEQVIRLLQNPEDATDEELLLIHAGIRHGQAARGFGAHPCPRGLEVKYRGVSNIYTQKVKNTMDGVLYQLTIHYVDAEGKPVANDYEGTIGSGKSYNVPSPEVEKLTPDKSVVSGTMGKEDTVITVTYTSDAYNLVVSYQYENGSEAASTYSAKIEEGQNYSVNSPAITGYTADKLTVSGTMGATPVEVTVTYTVNQYKLTVHYVDADGKKLRDDHTENVAYNGDYSVDSPAVTGYTADKLTVSGTMETTPVEETVTYNPKEYDLTIHYVYEDGTQVKADYTEKVKFNDTYSVESPEGNEGYYPDQYTVSGTMDTEGKVITVTYSEGYPGICDALKEVSLSAGTHRLYVNGKDMGEFTFTKSGSSWRIKDASGKYLAVSGGKLTYSTSATNWTYSNNRLSYSTGGWFFGLFSTTYYLTADANGLAVTTSNRNNTVAFYDGTPGANGRHQPAPAVHENEVAATCKAVGGYDEVVYCSVCGEKLHTNHVETPISETHTPGEPVHENEVAATCTEDGRYDEVTYCTVCKEEVERHNGCVIAAKGHTPGKAKRETIDNVDYMVTRCTVCGVIIKQDDAPAEVINANVTVTSRTSGFWIFSTTTYTAKILAMSDDPAVAVSKVEYSTNGSSWRTGTSYQSISRISTLYVRVTDSTGAVTNFVYKNGTVTKL